MKHPITEFTNRLARHHDELKWLYCELYHDEEAFAYFVQMLKRSWDQRKTALRNQDVKREADPDWYRRRELLGMMLYVNAFGFARIQRFFTERTYKTICFCALTFYCLAKSYSFFTGANHLESGIPLGTPGAILSSGLILPLNICVGLVVACTMYAFYALFRKGGF